jgi:hypothetical protein
VSEPVVDLSFPHQWQAEILPVRPAILPARHHVYPSQAEEIERGALEVLVRPVCEPGRNIGCASLAINEESGPTPGENPAHGRHESGHNLAGPGSVGPGSVGPGFSPDINLETPVEASAPGAKGTGFSPYNNNRNNQGASAPEPTQPPPPQLFLATCAVGFLDPIVPTGIWSCPNPRELCAVSGGYAYIIDAIAPERFTMIAFRPVLEIRPAVEAGLLLFVGHYSILAWGKDGQAWQSDKLSDEGITIAGIESGALRGLGWKMMTDKETEFAIDMQTGARISSGG